MIILYSENILKHEIILKSIFVPFRLFVYFY